MDGADAFLYRQSTAPRGRYTRGIRQALEGQSGTVSED